MRRLSVYLAALLLAIVLSYSSPTSAGKSLSGADLTPLFVPQFAEPSIVPCGTTEVLARISYWPRPGDNRYIAKFVGEGGPGKVQIQSDLDQRVFVSLPASSLPQEYTLELPYPPIFGGGSLGLANFAVGVITAPCTFRGTSIVVSSLNVFVGP